MSNRETAIGLARAGLAVFPCLGKKPLLKWKMFSTRSPDEVADMWAHFGGDPQPAIDCGKSGLLVVDLDRKNGKDGVAGWDALLDGQGANVDGCLIVETPSGGYHVWYRQHRELKLGNKTGSLPPGIDIRGIGGFVMAPDCVMPDGTLYDVVAGTLETLPIVPEWLVAAIDYVDPEAPQAPAWTVPDSISDARWRAFYGRILKGEHAKLAAIKQGQGRNWFLNKVAFTLGGHAAGISYDLALAALWDACIVNGSMKKRGPAQCRASFNSGWYAGQRRPFPGPTDVEIPDELVAWANERAA